MGFNPLKALRNVVRAATGKDADVAVANPADQVNPTDFTSPGGNLGAMRSIAGTGGWMQQGLITQPPAPAPAPKAPDTKPAVAATAVSAPPPATISPTAPPAPPTPKDTETAKKLDAAATAERTTASGAAPSRKRTLFTEGGYAGLVEGSRELDGEGKRKRPRTLMSA